jgi:hypothetical protein
MPQLSNHIAPRFEEIHEILHQPVKVTISIAILELYAANTIRMQHLSKANENGTFEPFYVNLQEIDAVDAGLQAVGIAPHDSPKPHGGRTPIVVRGSGDQRIQARASSEVLVQSLPALISERYVWNDDPGVSHVAPQHDANIG